MSGPGWSICTVAPTPSPIGPISVNGTCEADDRCVSSPKHFENTGFLLSCHITFKMDATLHVVEFEAELGYDTLTVEGVDYSGLDSPVFHSLASLKLSTPSAVGWELVVGERTVHKETGHAKS